MNTQTIINRLDYLRSLLAMTEEDLQLPGLRPKVRAGAQRLHIALTAGIQELELVLGMRSSTMLDLAN